MKRMFFMLTAILLFSCGNNNTGKTETEKVRLQMEADSIEASIAATLAEKPLSKKAEKIKKKHPEWSNADCESLADKRSGSE